MKRAKPASGTRYMGRNEISRRLGRSTTGQVIARVLDECPLMLYVLQVFKKIEKQLPQLTTLDLQYVSPELLKAKNLDLAVPGRLSRT